METIDNTMNKEYTEASDKALMSWSRVVKTINKYDNQTVYEVRFDPKLYNLRFESGWDQDYYYKDQNAPIVKAIKETKIALENALIFTKSDDTFQDYNEMDSYADYPRYGAGTLYRFNDEAIAHVFVSNVTKRLND